MPQIKYVFRDFWGVVAKLDIKKDGYVAQLEKLYNLPKEKLFDHLTLSLNKFRRGEISEKETRNTFSKSIKLPVHKNISRLFHTPLAEYAGLYKSISAFVKKLQKQGYKCIVLSDDYVPQVKKIRKAGRYNGFDDVLVSCEIGLSKYDDKVDGTTKMFSYVCKKYKITPSEMIFIDDVAKNCEIAKRAGVKAILASGPRQVIRDIKKILSIT